MTELLDYLRRPFDALYSVTSDETTGDYIRVFTDLEDNVYADTRPDGNLYSITSTQPVESTYSAAA